MQLTPAVLALAFAALAAARPTDADMYKDYKMVKSGNHWDFQDSKMATGSKVARDVDNKDRLQNGEANNGHDLTDDEARSLLINAGYFTTAQERADFESWVQQKNQAQKVTRDVDNNARTQNDQEVHGYTLTDDEARTLLINGEAFKTPQDRADFEEMVKQKQEAQNNKAARSEAQTQTKEETERFQNGQSIANTNQARSDAKEGISQMGETSVFPLFPESMTKANKNAAKQAINQRSHQFNGAMNQDEAHFNDAQSQHQDAQSKDINNKRSHQLNAAKEQDAHTENQNDKATQDAQSKDINKRSHQFAAAKDQSAHSENQNQNDKAAQDSTTPFIKNVVVENFAGRADGATKNNRVANSGVSDANNKN